jgi:hypothetical protein
VIISAGLKRSPVKTITVFLCLLLFGLQTTADILSDYLIKLFKHHPFKLGFSLEIHVFVVVLIRGFVSKSETKHRLLCKTFYK